PAPRLTSLPSRALGTILQDNALAFQLVSDAIGLLEVLGLARRLTGGDRGFDLGVGGSRRTCRCPAEPGLGVLLQEPERLTGSAQRCRIVELMNRADSERRVEIVRQRGLDRSRHGNGRRPLPAPHPTLSPLLLSPRLLP